MFSSECGERSLAKEALLDGIILHPELLAQNLLAHSCELCVDLLRGLIIADGCARYPEIARRHFLWLWAL